MLQIPFIKENKELIIDRYQKRNLDGAETLEKIIAADGKRIQTQQELDGQLAEANSLAKQIGDLFKSGKAAEANALKERSSELKASSSELKEQLAQTEEELKQLLYLLPNVPNAIVPEGKSDADNKIVSESGTVPNFNFDKLSHLPLSAAASGVNLVLRKGSVMTFNRIA